MKKINERSIILLIMVLQFIFLTTTMMIMPMGPDLTKAIGLNPADIGYLNGAATLAAAITGILLAPILDKFDRKKLLITFCLGKAVTTILCLFAWDTSSLMTILVVSALFGGPAGAVMLSVIMDIVPPEQRGKAMGMVSSSFAIAAIIGIPSMLELSRWFGWTVPFIVTGSLAVILTLLVTSRLPAMTAHLNNKRPPMQLREMISRPEIMIALILVCSHMMGHFLIVPNIASFFIFNLDYPREELGLLYLVGGIASIVLLQITGRLLDKGLALLLSLVLTLVIVATIYGGFVSSGVIPALLVFTLFMAATSARNSTTMAVISQLPAPHERAGFMSFYTTIGNISAGLAGFISAQLLSSTSTGTLSGMGQVGSIAMILMLIHPVLIFIMLKRLGNSGIPQRPKLA